MVEHCLHKDASSICTVNVAASRLQNGEGSGRKRFGGSIMRTTMETNKERNGVTACETFAGTQSDVSDCFPRHTIASLCQVGVSSLTPLRVEKLLETECDTHTHTLSLCGAPA